MSDSNDNDRTQVQSSIPPVDDPNSTMLIPRPGARSSNPAPVPTPPPAAAQGRGIAAMAQAPLTPVQPLATDFGHNPLINNASTLLAVMMKLRNMLAHDNPAGLQQQLADEIRKFEANSQSSQLSPEQIVTARYLLCTAIDEAVMNTPWGTSSGWSQRSLLSMFHNETFGGEKFFQIMDRVQQAPEQHVDLLELIYLLISLGFEGKYKLDPRGRDQLEMIRENLFRSIEQQRGRPAPDLSPHWQTDVKSDQGVMSYIPLWVVACCFLAILLLSYAGARVWLNHNTAPTAAYLDQLSAQISDNPPASTTQ
jgi:type VI secretion system protein ImpK